MACCGCCKWLKQGTILAIIAFFSVCMMALFITVMAAPFWRNTKTHVGIPLAKGYDRQNGGFWLLIWFTCIGGTILSFLSVFVYIFGDMVMNWIGLSWFTSTIKLTVYRVCNNATASFCWTAILSGLQCKQKEESFSTGFFLLFPTGLISLMSVALVYYYPCAPAGSAWSMCFGRSRTGDDDDDDDFDVDVRSDHSDDQSITTYGATRTAPKKKFGKTKTVKRDRNQDAGTGSSDSSDDSEDHSWWPAAFNWRSTDRTTTRSSTADTSDDEETGRRKRNKKGGWGFW